MIKKIALLLAITMIFSTEAYAYNFPEPDWGALLKERERAVNQTELELYTEGGLDAAPYYGARLEPRSGTYIGMITENSDGFRPLGSYLTYIDDMNQDDIYYPANRIIEDSNSAVMVGWTISDINAVDFNKVRSVLNNLSKYNKPMFIRFANEMNTSYIGDEPDKYIDVFRTVANMVHEYPNFAVVWSPIDLGSLDRPFEYYYPGDEYVDWVGISCYSIKYFMGNQNTDYKSSVYFMTGDWACATNRIKPIMDFMHRNGINKPVMISEGGVPTGNKFGESLEAWGTPRLRDMLWNIVMKYPQVKMINYFNKYMAYESEHFDISSYPYAAAIFNEAKASGAYITGLGEAPRFVFRPAKDGETLVANNGIVDLYTLAHVPKQMDITVNYTLDGAWYHSSDKIPYICRFDVNAVADGAHTLKISTIGLEKEYVLYKKGSRICFGKEPEGQDIRVTLNGSYLSFDQPPIIENGRTLVPMRAIFEALGANIDWNDVTKTVTAYGSGIYAAVTVGSDVMYVNGVPIMLDVSAKIVNGRTLVPVRAVSNAFNCEVDWNENEQTVVIIR